MKKDQPTVSCTRIDESQLKPFVILFEFKGSKYTRGVHLIESPKPGLGYVVVSHRRDTSDYLVLAVEEVRYRDGTHVVELVCSLYEIVSQSALNAQLLLVGYGFENCGKAKLT